MVSNVLNINLQDLATRLSSQSKALKVLINGNAADLSALLTTDKSSLLGAINELVGSIGEAGAVINDSAMSTTSVYSSSKTQAVADAAALATKNELLGGAAAGWDTLQEVKLLLDASDTADDDALAVLTTALGNRVRFDAAQTLTEPQKTQARANVGAQEAALVGDTATDFVAIFNAGLV